MSTTSPIKPSTETVIRNNLTDSVIVEEVISNLMSSQRSVSQKVTNVLDVASGILSKTNVELASEKNKSLSAEKTLEDLKSQLRDLQSKYEILYSGLLKVLTQKFPGESLLSIEHRMDAILLASNSGFEIGRHDSLNNSESSLFVDIIDDSLTQE